MPLKKGLLGPTGLGAYSLYSCTFSGQKDVRNKKNFNQCKLKGIPKGHRLTLKYNFILF